MVIPAATNSGCVSWGAVIFSTTVLDSDNDGLVDVWQTSNGYTDFKDNLFVALPGATPNPPGVGTRDLYIEIDYLVSHEFFLDHTKGHSHLPKQEALDMVGDAFWN